RTRRSRASRTRVTASSTSSTTRLTRACATTIGTTRARAPARCCTRSSAGISRPRKKFPLRETKGPLRRALLVAAILRGYEPAAADSAHLGARSLRADRAQARDGDRDAQPRAALRGGALGDRPCRSFAHVRRARRRRAPGDAE